MSKPKGIDYKKYPVLFVDDEEAALFGFTGQYELDFTILTAASGKEALTILESNPKIAVIITDQRMPGMTGVELLYRARLVNPDTVRMLITAYTDMEVVVDAINTGNIYRYINKPYNEEDLRFAIMQGIERYFLFQDRDRLYAEKIETLKKVTRSNRLNAIGILAAGMAHEINNPLVAINTFLELVPEKLQKLLDESGHSAPLDKEYWENFHALARKETKRIHRLINQLLNYSKTTEEDGFIPREVNLNDIIKEVILLLKNEAKKKKISFDLLLQPNLPKGKMDQEKMRQVVLNLVLNSIHATQGGKIVLTTSLRGEGERSYFEMKVSDTGSGISEQNLHRLFNPFYTTKESEGTGLGLMACHHIIDQHRGNIDVESKLGKGTTVTVQLPLDPSKYDRRKADRRIDL